MTGSGAGTGVNGIGVNTVTGAIITTTGIKEFWSSPDLTVEASRMPRFDRGILLLFLVTR